MTKLEKFLINNNYLVTGVRFYKGNTDKYILASYSYIDNYKKRVIISKLFFKLKNLICKLANIRCYYEVNKIIRKDYPDFKEYCCRREIDQLLNGELLRFNENCIEKIVTLGDKKENYWSLIEVPKVELTIRGNGCVRSVESYGFKNDKDAILFIQKLYEDNIIKNGIYFDEDGKVINDLETYIYNLLITQ